jgi:hypothetical protein
MKHLMQILAIAWASVLCVELENEEPGKGAEKKAQVCKMVREELDPLLPDWLNPIVENVTGILINGLVAFANRTGFFGQFASISAGLAKK